MRRPPLSQGHQYQTGLKVSDIGLECWRKQTPELQAQEKEQQPMNRTNENVQKEQQVRVE